MGPKQRVGSWREVSPNMLSLCIAGFSSSVQAFFRPGWLLVLQCWDYRLEPPVHLLLLLVISENRVFSLASVGLKFDFPALSSGLGVDLITNNAFLISRISATGSLLSEQMLYSPRISSRLRQKDLKFDTSEGYKGRVCVKKPKPTATKR